MEPPKGFLASVWNFICFLPYFLGLLILGFIKGVILCPLICLIISVGNSAVILGLWPVHLFYTLYCILSTKKLGPVLKLVSCLLVIALLIIWPAVGIVSSILGGAAYGFFAPMMGTFQAVGEGKTNQFFHCIYDGTWDTIKGSFNVVRDFLDVCNHSYFSIMDELRLQGLSGGKYYEIRLLYLPGACIAGVLGFLVDMPVISFIALCKSPYMLFKGWHRLFHDCIGREGPFLETICVPFAGLAILLWPLAVVGAVLGSIVSSIFLGAYAAVVAYQESSFWLGLCYIAASLSIYDEYSNDILDMPEGSCFPRPAYRKKAASVTSSRTPSFSRPQSFKKPPSRTSSLNAPMVELKSLELLDSLFKECRYYGEIMVSEGIITLKDIEDAKSNKDTGKVIRVGLPAYCILQGLIRSAKANSAGILLNDNVTEITSTNRPKDLVFDWFLNPLLIMKDQIKAENLSDAEEQYLGKLVLLSGDPERLRRSDIGSPPESEQRRAELDALARRLQGITRSLSRYPTFKRRFDSSMEIVIEALAKNNGDSDSGTGPRAVPRSRSMFARIFSQKSFKIRTSNHGSDLEAQPSVDRDVDII
ncbi:OLC1v1011332C1 [Oldenlandia corymbosa var. corymbosa]|uniref:OLC1v1011332C1 n=2 Tax=Oldenlandia corymbosa var. corymbosa TaxID=529605 RepID=A0AAV1DTF4_OLDCO|nr:OLC1v1011332C1 [Oldenlandia corymbosa var. corymbosa]